MPDSDSWQNSALDPYFRFLKTKIDPPYCTVGPRLHRFLDRWFWLGCWISFEIVTKNWRQIAKHTHEKIFSCPQKNSFHWFHAHEHGVIMGGNRKYWALAKYTLYRSWFTPEHAKFGHLVQIKLGHSSMINNRHMPLRHLLTKHHQWPFRGWISPFFPKLLLITQISSPDSYRKSWFPLQNSPRSDVLWWLKFKPKELEGTRNLVSKWHHFMRLYR